MKRWQMPGRGSDARTGLAVLTVDLDDLQGNRFILRWLLLGIQCGEGEMAMP